MYLVVKKTLELESFCKFDLPRGRVIFTLNGLSSSGKFHGPARINVLLSDIYFNLAIRGFLDTPGLARN